MTGAREKPCGRVLSPSNNWQTSVRRFGRSSDNKSTYEKCPSQSILVHRSFNYVIIPFSMRLRLLQQGKDLLPLHTGKTFEKVCNGVISLKMIKETLNRYPGPGKDRLASENFRVPRNGFLHASTIAPAATLREPRNL